MRVKGLRVEIARDQPLSWEKAKKKMNRPYENLSKPCHLVTVFRSWRRCSQLHKANFREQQDGVVPC